MSSGSLYRERLPSHYCTHCLQVTFEDDARCPECGRRQPPAGWESIQRGKDRWLGRVLDGRYVMTRLVGRGAMGSVYRAASLAISRDFAIKVINLKEDAGGIDADQIRARLHREIEAIGLLRNPHIVPFYEVIELYESFVGIVMDYVAGDTLEQIVNREGPLPAHRAVQVIRQVSNGIHEAHQFGMIHRDLKPENIMVERLPSGDDFSHVLDFGIVHVDDGVSLTTGFLGTPLYASPEQALGSDIDPRSDVYSMGAVLYFALTGQPPFPGTSVYKILQDHVKTPPPTLRQGNPSRIYPAPLESLVAEMLAKSPERRPQTLAQVIERLDAIHDEPGGAIPDSIEFELFDDHARYSVKNTANSLGESSSSVYESDELDETGPKAAIFHRGSSRGSVRRQIEAERHRPRTEFDRVFEGNTGAHTLGVGVDGQVLIGSASAKGDLLLGHIDGRLTLVRDGEATSLRASGRTSAVGLNGTLLRGTPEGVIEKWNGERFVREFAQPRGSEVTALALGGMGSPWVAGFESGGVYLRRVSRHSEAWERVLNGPAVASVASTDRAGVFCVARRHGELEISTYSAPDKVYQRFPIGGVARALAISQDGHLAAAVLEDESIVVHLVEGGRRVHLLKDSRNKLFALRFAGTELLGYFERQGQLYARTLDQPL